MMQMLINWIPIDQKNIFFFQIQTKQTNQPKNFIKIKSKKIKKKKKNFEFPTNMNELVVWKVCRVTKFVNVK